jgi:hypothetical protein
MMTPMSITIRSSSQEVLEDPVLLRKELEAGHVVELRSINISRLRNDLS